MTPEPNDRAPHGQPPGAPQRGYETLDAHAGATFRAGLYILGVMFVVAAVVVPLYRLYARREAASQGRPASVIQVQPSPETPTFPKLVTSEPLVLAEFRSQEDALLTSYGWVEKDRGIARMPIAEAMRLVGERGQLPAFPAPPPSTAGPTPPASAAGSTQSGASPPPGAGASPQAARTPRPHAGDAR